MTYVFDASTILRFTDKEAGFDRVRVLLHGAGRGDWTILISAVNWGEIVSVLYKRSGISAQRLLSNIAALPIRVMPIDASFAERAGLFKVDHAVPYADAFAGALAEDQQATLVTADYDFKNVPKGTFKIEFLPIK
jgi:PIN domain nuclease of toxin-antitoxin system